MTLIDEVTRKRLALPAGRHFRADDVIETIADQAKERGSPKSNEPE